MIRLTGAVPANVPVDHFEAQYITDTGDTLSRNPACVQKSQQGDTQEPYPLRHTDAIGLTRNGERF